jgi:hypothetical protein
LKVHEAAEKEAANDTERKSLKNKTIASHDPDLLNNGIAEQLPTILDDDLEIFPEVDQLQWAKTIF